MPLKTANRTELTPGTVLVREWDRRSHRVMVVAGGFAWNGQTTEFLDAETGPKSPPETTDVPRDQKGPEPIAEIPAQTAYLSLMGKYAGSAGLGGGGYSPAKPVSADLTPVIPCYFNFSGIISP